MYVWTGEVIKQLAGKYVCVFVCVWYECAYPRCACLFEFSHMNHHRCICKYVAYTQSVAIRRAAAAVECILPSRSVTHICVLNIEEAPIEAAKHMSI